MNRIVYLITFIVLFISANLLGQQRYKSERKAEVIEYTVKEGLPITSISAITQTEDGYIWISGLEGTVRFNGYKFEELGKDFGLSQMQFHYYDSLSNRIYFASPTMFIIYEQNEFKIFTKKDGYANIGLPGRYIAFIKKDSKNRVWIGSSTLFVDAEFNGGLTMFDGNSFTVFDSTSFPLDNAINMFETPYGDLIFMSAGKNTRTSFGAFIALFKDNEFSKIDEDNGITLQGTMFETIIGLATLSEPSVDNKGNTWIHFSGVGRSNFTGITNRTSGVLMYDGVEFKEFPGLHQFLRNGTRVTSVFYLKDIETVYAVLSTLRGEVYQSEMNILFKFNGTAWEKVDLFGQTGPITDLSSGEQNADYKFSYARFNKANSVLPDLLVIGSVQETGAGSHAEQYFHYDGGWSKYDALVGFPSRSIEKAAVLTTRRGFSLYYPNNSILLTEKDNLNYINDPVPSMYRDKTGLVYIYHSYVGLPSIIKINYDGINIWDGEKLIPLTEQEGLSSNLVYSISEDKNGQIWAATHKGLNLCRVIKNSENEFVVKVKQISSSDKKDYSVSAILETSEGKIYSWQNYVRPASESIPEGKEYFGVFEGDKLIRMDYPLRDSELEDYSYQFLFLREMPSGDLLLEASVAETNASLASTETKLFIFDGAKWKAAPEEWNVPKRHLKYVGIIDDKMFYLSPGHFYSFDSKEFVDLSDSVNANADFRILKEASSAGTFTHINANGYIYIRVRLKGLAIFDGTNLNFYTTRNGLPTANLFNPTIDKNSNLYFAHQFGGLIVNGEEFNVYYNEDISEGQESSFTLDINNDYTIFYSGLGVFIDKEKSKNIAVDISSVQVGDSEFFKNKPTDFSFDENSFLFNYTSLNYKHADETGFQHILEGYDKEWSRLSNFQFTEYQNLPPGKYIFKVRAAEGIRDFTKEATYAFAINPPLWQTWWAYVLYIFAFFSFLYSLRAFELNRQRKNSAIKESQLRAEAAEAQSRVVEAENQRKTQELEEARQLQLSMLPPEIPQLPNLEIAVYMKTATEVGGDYYDFHLHLDGTLTVVLGDATGHGMQSGMMVSIMKSLFMSDRSSKELKPFFQNSNQAIKDMHLGRLMMALTCVQLNSNKIKLANAGMPATLIYREKTNRVEEIAINNLPLGGIKDFEYETIEEMINPGDTILMLSDGYPELANKNGEQMGYSKVKSYFSEIAEKSPDEIVDHLKVKGFEWADGKENDDDVTFAVIKVK